MTMRTTYNVICECGHAGAIILSENDIPYSNNHWQKYSLKGLNGNITSVPANADWQTVFRVMSIKCQKCNALLSINNLIP